MKSLQDFFRLGLIALIIGLGVGYALADWSNPPPGSPPTSCNTDPNAPGCAAPINVSGISQTKTGPLIISNVLTGTTIFAGKLGIGAGPVTSFDPTAALDVDGQIRIRGGSPGPNKVLKTSSTVGDTTGLASWQENDVGITKLTEGFGIDFADYSGYSGTLSYAPIEITSTGTIAVAAGQFSFVNPPAREEIQRRVSVFCNSPGAMTKIGVLGTESTNCSPFVTTVRASGASGLTLEDLYGTTWTSATSGPISLAVNVGSGLWIDPADNKIKLNVSTAAGDGLRIDTMDNTVKFETCPTNGQTWKYNTATLTWECANFVFTQPLGESVMYLRSPSAGTPPSCPTLPSPGWTPAPNASGLTWTGNENVSAGNVYNKMRACYRSDKTCQVIYLKSTVSPPALCPTSPVAWTEAASSNETAPGGLLNYVRTCYLCN